MIEVGALVLAAGVIGFGVITILVACTVINGALSREIRTVRAGQYAGEIGYRRYIAASLSILRAAAIIVLVVPIVAVIFLFGNLDAQSALFGTAAAESAPGVMLGYVICLFGALYAIPFSLYELLGTPIGTRALAALRGIQLGGREALGIHAKRALMLYAPLFVVCEATGAVAFVSVELAFGVLIIGVIAVFILRRAFAGVLVRWTSPSQPIEQTPWAALSPRIHGWGRLAGVGVKAVYVQQTGRLGTGTIMGLGPRRARTLVIGDALLGSTDWRQLDALIVYTLATNTTSVVLRGRLIRLLISYVALAVVAGIFVALVLIGQNGITISPALFALLAIFALLLLLGLFAYSLVSAILSRRTTRLRFLAADARVAAIVGDPLALMVALNTLNALSGAPNDRRLGYLPSTVERVAALDTLLRQPGPRAPFAWQLVPSIVPVYVGPYCLTVPLAAAAQSVPAPLPAGPYPIVMPPAAAPMPAPVPVPYAAPPMRPS